MKSVRDSHALHKEEVRELREHLASAQREVMEARGGADEVKRELANQNLKWETAWEEKQQEETVRRDEVARVLRSQVRKEGE